MRFGLAFALLATCASSVVAQSTPGAGMVVFRGERSAIILRVPARDAQGALRPRQPDLVQSCGGAMRIARSEGGVAIGAAGEPTSVASALLDVTVIANPGAGVSCDGEWAQADGTEMPGESSAPDGNPPPSQTVRDARFSIGGQTLAGRGVEQGLLQHLAGGRLSATDAGFRRLALEMGAIAPAQVGGGAPLMVAVSFAGGGVDDLVEVPWESLRDLWQLALAAKLAAATVNTPVVSLPAPTDANLRDARAQLTSGGVASEAIANVTRRAHAYELSRSDRTWARAQSALALDALGDSLGVRLTMLALLQEEPCFRWRADAPAALRDFTAALAPTDARCAAVPLWQVAGRAIVAPGFARPALRDGRASRRSGVTVFVVGTLVASQWQNQAAIKNYNTYLAAQIDPIGLNGQPAVANLYQYAANARGRALVLSAMGIAAWTVSGVVGIVNERRFARRLEETDEVGVGIVPDRVGWRPAVELTPGRVSFGLRHAW